MRFSENGLVGFVFKLQVKSMLVSIDRLQRGCVKKLIGMNRRSSCGESILKRIARGLILTRYIAPPTP